MPFSEEKQRSGSGTEWGEKGLGGKEGGETMVGM